MTTININFMECAKLLIDYWIQNANFRRKFLLTFLLINLKFRAFLVMPQVHFSSWGVFNCNVFEGYLVVVRQHACPFVLIFISKSPKWHKIVPVWHLWTLYIDCYPLLILRVLMWKIISSSILYACTVAIITAGQGTTSITDTLLPSSVTGT